MNAEIMSRLRRCVALFCGLILVLLGWLPEVSAQSNDTQLILGAKRRVVRLGSDAECTVKISGKAVQSIFRAIPGVYVPIDDAYFKNTFKFKTVQPGIVEVGPLSVAFMNQSLKSNRLRIKVLEEWTGRTGVEFAFADDEVQLGETTQLVVEQFYDAREETQRWSKLIKSDPKMDVDSGQLFSYSSIGSTRKLQSDGQVFEVTPKVRGKLVISKETIPNLPDSIHFNPVSLNVK